VSLDWDATTWIALASLAISVVVGVRQHLAAGRANLTAEWEDREHVIITNHGPGSARKVEVKISDIRDAPAAPVAHFGVYQSMRFQVLRALGAPLPDAEILWRDNRLRRQRATIILGDPPAGRPRAAASSKSNLEAEVRAIARHEAAAEITDKVRKSRRRY
jgi:hypothetical protein